MDQQTLTTTILDVMNQALGQMTAIIPSAPPEAKVVDIDEYDGRMKVSGLDKFESSSYISVINFYLNQSDLQKHKAKGAFILMFDSENAGKFYKSLGFSVSDDEDDISMINTNGQACEQFANSLKPALTAIGCPDFVISPVTSYKNKVLEGVEYSPEQKTKLELTFTYFKHKAIVVELTLSGVTLTK